MDMIKSLHRKFILIATAAIFTIVFVALAVINGTLYFGVRAEIHTVMDHILANGGSLSGALDRNNGSWLNDESWTENTPEFSYQTRYFSVLLDHDGTAKVIDVNHIAAFSAKEAVETAVEAVESGDSEGYFKKNKASYAYKLARTGEGDILVVILDCTRDMAAVNAFLRYSSLFGLLCIAGFVAIVSIFSKRAIRPFQQNMENQKRFITNAGHELKTPVAIISANAEALSLINGKNEWIDNILKQVRRLAGLIDDMVLLAKVGEASKKDIRLTDVNLSEAAENGAAAFRQLAAEQEKKLETDLAPGIHVEAEPKFVNELISILLDNAVKYCDDGGVIRISAAAKKKGNAAELIVSNHYREGEGVDYTRFFERFYRGDTSHASDKSGYGIGLSVAADMVKLMGGKIGVRYENGMISFVVELLPAKPKAKSGAPEAR